jgi:glyoxylase-like metal-dependent hydrolase (beta-lactamase superfamily II)
MKWDVFVTKRDSLTRDLPPGKEQWAWVPTSATLIYGNRDAVLVDAMLTVEQVRALVEWVAASGKNLTTIYITHGHGDHFFGIAALQNRFPMRERSQHLTSSASCGSRPRRSTSRASGAHAFRARFRSA